MARNFFEKVGSVKSGVFRLSLERQEFEAGAGRVLGFRVSGSSWITRMTPHARLADRSDRRPTPPYWRSCWRWGPPGLGRPVGDKPRSESIAADSGSFVNRRLEVRVLSVAVFDAVRAVRIALHCVACAGGYVALESDKRVTCSPSGSLFGCADSFRCRWRVQYQSRSPGTRRRLSRPLRRLREIARCSTSFPLR